MERLKRMGVVTPRGTPPAWTVRRDPGGFLPEEQALEFGQTLQRVAANDPNLNAVTCHEVASQPPPSSTYKTPPQCERELSLIHI